MLRSCLLALAAVLAALPVSASAETFLAVKDNSIYHDLSGGPSSNPNGDLCAGRKGTGSSGKPDYYRGLIGFDLGAIPRGATIESVSLTLKVTDKPGQSNAPVSFWLVPVGVPWGDAGTSPGATGNNAAMATDGDATWDYAFYYTSGSSQSSVAWTQAGAIGPSPWDPAGRTSVGTAHAIDEIVHWSSADAVQLRDDVQAWVNQADRSLPFSWMIVGNESMPWSWRSFASSESATPPQLAITYTVPEPSTVVGLAGLMALGLVGLVRRARTA
jgi:hypothetical protein